MNTSGKSNFWLIIIGVVVLLMGFILFLINNDQENILDGEATKQALVLPEVMVEQTIPAAEIVEQTTVDASDTQVAEDAVMLPELKDSDVAFTQGLLAVSPNLKHDLFKNQLIKKYMFAMNDMSQGIRPSAKLLRELALKKPFSVIQVDDKVYISSKTYRRYDRLAQAFSSMDNQAAVALYKKYLPLFQTIFDDFSYPSDYQVMDIIKGATGKILQAPVVTDRIEVIRPSVYYKFSDPKLEKLSSLEKQMLRMGPENTRLIQDKLREIMQLLLEQE